MAFELDDAAAAAAVKEVAEESLKEGLKEGTGILDGSPPEISFESTDFQDLPNESTDFDVKSSEISKGDFEVPNEIEKDFSPDKFNNLGEAEDTSGNIETTETAVKEAAEDCFKEDRMEGTVTFDGSLPEVSFESSDFQDLPNESGDIDVKSSEISKGDFEMPNEIEKDFSPGKFNNLGETEKLANNIETTATEKVERTSTFEEQTIDNFKLEEMRPKIEKDMILGSEHDGSVLRRNMEVAMNRESNPEESNAHHIVGRDTPQAAKKLEEFEIDRNDPANGIFLPNSSESPLKGAVHGQGRHTADYSNEVEQRFAGVTTREEALEVLQSLKEDLYNGDLNVHSDIPANK